MIKKITDNLEYVQHIIHRLNKNYIYKYELLKFF